MNRKVRGLLFTLAGLALGFAMTMIPRSGTRAQSGPAQAPAATSPAPKMAEEAFKNIQVMKGIPADQIVPAMQFVSASLGVDCEHCHVRNALDKDDKRQKQTARKMIQMMFAINKDNFNGQRQVTCNTCHMGKAEPTAIPIISEEEPMPELAEVRGQGGPNPGGLGPSGAGAGGPGPGGTPAGPSADQLLDKYVAALGGADAIKKISSRIEKGTISFRGRPMPVEVFAKAPDKRISIAHLPNGEMITAYDGHVGWLGNPAGPPREMSSVEADVAKLEADFYLHTRAQQDFARLRPGRPEKVGDRDAYVVLGLAQGRPPAKMYFDEQSGLLVRWVAYEETPLGRLPVQTDFADYRDADGVKLPFKWTVARPGGRFTIQVEQVQQNAAIDDAKFAKPPAPLPPEPKPASQ